MKTLNRAVVRLLAAGGIALLVTLAGCAAGPGLASTDPGAAGFWQGMWHGLIAPVTFLVSLANASVSIYEVHNDGHFYDAGFLIGVSIVFGSLARGSCVAYRPGRRPENRS